MTGERPGDYGVDAPWVPGLLAAGGLFSLAGAAFSARGGTSLAVALVVNGLFLLASAGTFLHASRRGKPEIWRRLLTEMGLRGDEHLLDMGCGRGAVLVMAARHLPLGRATGLDLWRRVDQSGNTQEAARTNAALAGVADRVDLRTGDMTGMPFDDASFDVVTASMAIHNIKGQASKDRAIDEAVRVLRPGGRLVIADISAARRYAHRLDALGMADLAVRSLGWQGWYGGPWVAMKAVTARKPAASKD